MKKNTISILIVEDNPADARLIVEMLKASTDPSFRFSHADRLGRALEMLEEDACDVILLDLGLPDSKGLAGLDRIAARAPHLPIILLTGMDDENVGLQALHAGASDYLVKGQINQSLVSRSIRYAIERKRAEETLRESETRFRALAENVPDMITRFDRDLRLLYANPAVVKRTGRPREALIGRTAGEYGAAAASAAQWEKAAREVLDSGETRRIESTSTWQGETRVFDTLIVPERDAGGAVQAVIAIARDITERKRAEEEVKRSQNWLERIAGTTPDIIFVLDIINSFTVYANKSLIELLGYAPEEFREPHNALEKGVEPEDLPRVAEFYRNMADAKPGEVRVLTHRAIHKDGRTLWLENRVTPFSWDENDRLAEVIGISHDVTDLKRAHEVLQRDRETFERLVDERTSELVDIHHELDKARHLSDIGMLASTVAHELRNPLGVIKTAAYNINRKKQGDALDKHLQTINKKVDESNQIINNLLMYARIKQPAYETVRIRDLLHESLESARARTDGRPVTFLDECGPVENVVATLDPIQIAEVMSNILTNAAQAIPVENGGTVTVSARASDGLLRIQVRDTGTGIDPDVLPHVFEPFFTSKSKGTGLGLSLCRELVSLHNGSINIESELGKGTTVTVVLPLSP